MIGVYEFGVSKILVGLSGGVDSAVAAALLLEQGHEVTGGYMKNWINEEGIAGDCPWEQDVEDAHAVAKTLGIELRVVDLIDQYRDRMRISKVAMARFISLAFKVMSALCWASILCLKPTSFSLMATWADSLPTRSTSSIV